jgi:hypothetical protein
VLEPCSSFPAEDPTSAARLPVRGGAGTLLFISSKGPRVGRTSPECEGVLEPCPSSPAEDPMSAEQLRERGGAGTLPIISGKGSHVGRTSHECERVLEPCPSSSAEDPTSAAQLRVRGGAGTLPVITRRGPRVGRTTPSARGGRNPPLYHQQRTPRRPHDFQCERVLEPCSLSEAEDSTSAARVPSARGCWSSARP